MPTLATIALHNARTRRSELAYQFTPKHHGGDRNATQWLPELTLGEEFAIFDHIAIEDSTDAKLMMSDFITRFELIPP